MTDKTLTEKTLTDKTLTDKNLTEKNWLQPQLTKVSRPMGLNLTKRQLLIGDALIQGLFGMAVGEHQPLQRRQGRHQSGTALDHRYLGRPYFPKGGGDIVGRIIGTHHHTVIAAIGIRSRMDAAVALFPSETLGVDNTWHLTRLRPVTSLSPETRISPETRLSL